VLKIDRSLVSRVDRDFHKQETLKSLVGLSRRIGAATVAEGLETREEAISAVQLGVDLLQGYFICRPQPRQTLDASIGGTSFTVASLAHEQKKLMVRKIYREGVRYRLVTTVARDVVERLASRSVEEFSNSLEEITQIHPDIECAYVIARSGQQVTATVLAAPLTPRKRSVVFWPSSIGTDHSLQEYCYAIADADLSSFMTDPQVSFASGHFCRTFSMRFRHHDDAEEYVLCLEVVALSQNL
jgi:hypothetical protein